MLRLETGFNKSSASHLETGIHLSQHQQCVFHWVMQKVMEISLSNQQMETLCIDSRLKFLRHYLKAELALWISHKKNVV